MGHAYPRNISIVVNKRLRTGDFTIRSCVEELTTRKMKVQAAEGSYDDEIMLAKTVTDIVHDLYEVYREIEPILQTRAQKRAFNKWNAGELDDDDSGRLYDAFDSIRWKALKPRLTRIDEIEN